MLINRMFYLYSVYFLSEHYDFNKNLIPLGWCQYIIDFLHAYSGLGSNIFHIYWKKNLSQYVLQERPRLKYVLQYVYTLSMTIAVGITDEFY